MKQDRRKRIERTIRYLKLRAELLKARRDRLPLFRLVCFTLGFATGFLLYHYYTLMLAFLVVTLFLMIFIALGIIQRRLKQKIDQNRVLERIYTRHRASVGRNYSFLNQLNKPFEPRSDLETDLNLIGNSSLMSLVDTTTTLGGFHLLRHFISEPSYNKTEILERRDEIIELTELSNFRNQLEMHLKEFNIKPLESNRIKRWIEQPKSFGISKVKLVLAIVVNLLNIILATGYFLYGLSPFFIYSFILHTIFYFIFSKGQQEFQKNVVFISIELNRLKSALFYLSSQDYQNYPRLGKRLSLFKSKRGPKAMFSKLKIIHNAIGLRSNLILGFVLNVLLIWDIAISYFFGKLHQDLKEVLPVWLENLIQIEALSSLANFAWLNPGYTYATLIDQDEGPALSAKKIRHPLIEVEKSVANDFLIEKQSRVHVVTGSNMSGKSTYLRTLAINAILTYSGACAAAAELKLPVYHLYTCIKVSDSLADGLSYFYAEVRRLSGLLNVVKNAESKIPVFYVVDEIFKGTNNKERLQGSKAFIRALIKMNATGLIATHDLELTDLAKHHENVENYHFTDNIKEGKMVFDYKLYHGPCQSTNALQILALEGLPVL